MMFARVARHSLDGRNLAGRGGGGGTHPNPIQSPTSIRRVLLVRPTSFETPLQLNERHGQTYAAFLLCDSPDSRTGLRR